MDEQDHTLSIMQTLSEVASKPNLDKDMSREEMERRYGGNMFTAQRHKGQDTVPIRRHLELSLVIKELSSASSQSSERDASCRCQPHQQGDHQYFSVSAGAEESATPWPLYSIINVETIKA